MEQKTTILFFSKRYDPHIGGVEKHIAKISKVLTKKGFRIIIVTEKYKKGLPLFEKLNDIEIYRIPIGKSEFFKKFYIWKWILVNFWLLRKACVIHIHDVFYWILPFRIFLPFKKVYITFHGYEGYPIKKRWIIMRKIAQVCTNGNIIVGEFMKKWYKTGTNYVIYGATELVSIKKLASNPYSAVFFGRLDSQTGILEYIKAYKILKKKYPKFELTVIGEGEMLNKLPKNIKVYKFEKNINKYIEKNRFIFVSRYLSILEAKIMKKTVISVWDNPVKKDYLLTSPFKNYVSVASNAIEIADKVSFYIENPKKEKILNENGYLWAKKQTWEKVVGVYLRLWKIA